MHTQPTKLHCHQDQWRLYLKNHKGGNTNHGNGTFIFKGEINKHKNRYGNSACLTVYY